MSRRTARDYAYKLIFEQLFNNSNSDEESPTLQSMLEDSEITNEDRDYMKTVVSGVKEHYDDLRLLIESNSQNFKIERIFKPDLAALFLAVYEMKYMDNIPCAVSINEAISIVKSYSTTSSYIFVNGVLSGIYKQIGGDKKC